MKKILLFAIGILTSVSIQAVTDVHVDKGMTYQYDTTNNEATLIKGPSTTFTEVEIPATITLDDGITTYNVKTIGKNAFKDNKSIIEVVIANGIETINESAFQNCDQLKKITLPSTLGTIKSSAFSGCSRLVHICCLVETPTELDPTNLPSNEMMTLYVPQGKSSQYAEKENWYEKFGNRIYEGEMKEVRHNEMQFICASISHQATLSKGLLNTQDTIVVPNTINDDNTYTVTGIDREAFSGFSKIKRLTISKDVTAIGPDAFKNCSELIHVWCQVESPQKLSPNNLPNNEMMTLYVPQDSLTKYNDNVNWNNRFKGRIYGGKMFAYKNGNFLYICAEGSHVATLYSVNSAAENFKVNPTFTIGANDTYTVRGIDKRAFYGFTNLTSFEIPESITAIGPEAFKNCGNLVNVFCKFTKPFNINDNVFSNKGKATLYIPNSSESYDGITGWDFMSTIKCDDVEEFNVNGAGTYIGWTDGETKNAKLIRGVSGSSEVPFTITHTITSTKRTYDVVAIADNAFNGIGSFQNLIIEDGVKSIGANAFRGRTALKTVVLPSSVKAIGDNAFNGCTGLTSINFDGVETIGTSAFQNCTGLELIKLPACLSTIGSKAFSGCNNLVEVWSLDESPCPIDANVFPADDVILYVPTGKKGNYSSAGWNFWKTYQGNRITKVSGNLTYAYADGDSEAILLKSDPTDNVNFNISSTAPETSIVVKVIAKSAFAYNTLLESVSIPSDVEAIGKFAFKNCSKLGTINLPSNLKSIRDYAFEGNSSLTNVVIPEGTYAIGEYAFKRCTKIEELTLPTTLSSIGDYAFYESDILSTIHCNIPGSSLFKLNDYVFSSYIVPTIFIPEGSEPVYLNKEGWKNFKGCYTEGKKGTYPKEGTADMIYYYYTSNKTATLAQVNSTGDQTDITISNEIEIDGVKYHVTSIGDNAFKTNPNKANIAKLTISEGIKTIGANAFKGCSGLTSVTLPDSLTIIGKSAFEGNTSLESINLPDSVKAIGAYAFKDCSGLTRIKWPSILESIGDYAFANNSKLDSLIIPEGVKAIGMYAFKNWSKLNRVNLPSTLEKIDEYAFSDCANITTITSKIDSLFRIEDNVFQLSSSTPSTVYQNATLFVPIDTATVNGNVEKYKDTDGWKLFDNIIEGEKLTKTIDMTGEDKLIYECLTGLKTATLTNSVIKTATDLSIEGTVLIDTVEYKVTAIGNEAFKGRTTITNLVISDSIKTIGTSAFEGCTALKKVKLSSNLTTSGSIGQYAFKNCPLTHICSKSKTPPTINDNVFSNSTATLFVPQGSNYSIEGWSKFSSVVEGELMDVQPKDGMSFDCLKNGEGETAQFTAILTKYSTPANSTGIVEVPNTVTFNNVKYAVKTVKTSAFSGNSSFTTLTIKEGVKRIEPSAFYNCSNLKEVVLPSTLDSIGVNAFDKCNSITKVTSDITKGNLFKINENVFAESVRNNANTILYVPIDPYVADATAEEYRKKEGWNFLTIIEGVKRIGTVEQKGVGKMTYEYLTGPRTATLTGAELDDIYALTIVNSVKIGNVSYMYKVTAIGDNVFKGKTNIKTLVISDSIERIGTNAFQGCSSLERIELPSTLVAIGEKAFDGCKSLVYVCSKDQTPYDINSNVFPSNTTATLFVPKGYKDSYENLTTSGWNNFKKVVEGYFVDEKEVDDLTYYFLKDSDKDGAARTALLNNAKSTIDNAAIPDSVKLGDTDYYKVTIIGESTFKDNTSLKYLTIPEYVDSIGMNAFNGCNNIKSIESKVKKPFAIDNNVFSTNTPVLYVPADSVRGISRDKYLAETGWNNFKNIYEGEKKDTVCNNMTFNYASSDTIAILISSNNTDENLIIPDSITVNKANYKVITIDESAFKDNTSLKYLTIPEYVDSIGVNAFNGCDNIKTIVSKVKDPFDIKDAFPASANNAILYVPSDSVRGISRDRYLEKTGWKNFKNIYEGEKKDTVCNNMTFNYASSDTIAILISSNNTDENLVIPDSITVNKKNYKVITIDESAFKGKSNIKYLTIPEYVDSIGVNAFTGCDSIKSIVSKIKEPFDIEDNVFSTSVYNVPLYVPVGTRADYQNKNGWKKFKNIFEGEKKQYEDEATGLIYDYVTGDKTAILVKASRTASDVLIPESIPVDTIKYKVIAISDSVFKNNESIKYLTISENIKSIGVSAFQGCKNLERVELPSTLTEIGEKAFDGCNVITHLCTKDKTPTAINTNVFSKYTTATLFVPDGTIGSEDVAGTYKGENGWKKFTKMVEGYLVDVHTKDSLTYNCLMNGEGNNLTRTATLIKAEKLIDITIPDTLLIEKDSIAYKVVTIDEGAIKGNSVVNLKIGENVKTIGANAFQNCSSLKRLELPSSLTTIGENAFNNCKNLIHISSKIKNPSAITGNEFSVFTTANLYVPDGTTSLYKGTTGWKDFDNIVEGCFVDEVTSDDKTLTYICLQNGEGKDVKNNAILTKATSSNVEVPDSFVVDNVTYKVVTINNKGNAVFQSKNLQKVWLPSTLTKIGDNAFDGCKSITHVCVKTSTPPEISGNVFPENLTATLYVPDGAKASYKGNKIWNLFPAINEGYLVNVATKDKILYDCLTNGEGAKATRSAILTKSASSTTDVVIPDSVSIDDIYYKVKAISDSAFIDNVKLLNISIPENVDSIGDRAFEGCNSIATITSKIKKPFKINDNVFPTSDAALYVPVGTKADYQNTDGWKKFTNIYEGVKAEYTLSDKKMTFTYATGEKSAVLIKTTTTAKNVEIPDSFEVDNMYYYVVAIENSVFKGKTTIESLTLPSTLTKIGDNAFYGCNNIKYIISKVEKPFAIADSVFTVPTAILYVPVGTRAAYEKAGGWNFNNILEGDRKETTEKGFTYVYASGDKIATLTKAKTSEKNVIIPESFVVDKDTIKVVAIGPDAFQNITSMKMIELPSTLKEIGEKAFDGCSGITSICSKIKTPFAINDNVFSESTYTAAKVYVPTGTSTDYKETGGWKKFTEMLEGELKEITTDNGITYNCVAGPNIATIVKGATTKAEVTIEGTVKDGETTYKVTEIASNAFSSNSKLEKVTINDSISVIGSGAFQNCANLKEVVIAGSVTSIGDYAFDKCSRLALVVSHIEKPFAVSDNVFPSTGAKLNIPIGSTELYQKASGWDKFSTILEGEMLETEVGGMTYLYVTGSRTATLIKGTTKEKDLTIPPTITVDGVDYSVTAIGESALANANSVESLTISEGVDSIAANAFKNCAYLNKLSLPSTLAKIGDNAFSKCDRIIHIQISVKTPVGISENVFTTTTYENATLYIPVGTTELYTNEAAIGWNKFKSVLEGDITEMTIEGMTYMCVPNLKIAKLIKGVANTKEVTIPSKIYKNGVSYQVVNVEKSAFYGFGSIEKLIISEGIKTISSTAFKNCSKLQSVVLPASMESIGENAFENCSRLTTVTCAGEKPATISDNTFPSTELSINVPNDSLVNVYKADEQWGKFSNILVTTSSISDDDDAQSNPASYQITTEEGDEENPTVAIVDDVNVSGSFAIPETVDYNGTAYTVTVIAPNTFENNTDLTDITIPSTITAIGESAFAGCSNLKSITVNIATPLDLSAPAAVRGLTRMTRSGGSSVFEGVDKETCILYVPEGSVDLYKAADVWKEFTNIQPIPATGIWEQIFTDGIPYDVYNMQGRKVRTQTTTLKGLPRGVYIVNGKKYVVK